MYMIRSLVRHVQAVVFENKEMDMVVYAWYWRIGFSCQGFGQTRVVSTRLLSLK